MALQVAANDLYDQVVAILDVFSHEDLAANPPTPRAKLWRELGIGPNDILAMTIPLTKLSSKYEGRMVFKDDLAAAVVVQDLVDATGNAIAAGGVYEIA